MEFQVHPVDCVVTSRENPAQPGRSSAAEDVQEERLDLIIRVMREDYVATTCGASRACEERMPGASRRCFQRDLFGTGEMRDIGPGDLAGEAKTLSEISDEFRIGSALRSEPVVEMAHGQSRALRGKGVQQRNGIAAARDAHQCEAIG
jgi:hypothetical protein